jgi:3-hydroxyacyl-CoA dehydrogenase/enoyl-CoA hydratase/3-hydroxybutyryl-CoA epimerase
MSEGDTRRLMEWVVQLGRTPRRVPDGPGFLFNRLLIPYLLEAIFLAKEGIRTDRIDQAMASFGMVHGPMEHLDLMGLDVVHSLVEMLRPTWQGRIPEDDTVETMVGKNWLGQKTEAGFYRYRKGRKKLHHRSMGELREAGRRQRAEHIEVLSVADQKKKVTERLGFLWINEAARCLESGYLSDPKELDLTLCLGGWAPQRGGPLAYARNLGRQKVSETFERLAERHGDRYAMSPWLERWLPGE